MRAVFSTAGHPAGDTICANSSPAGTTTSGANSSSSSITPSGARRAPASAASNAHSRAPAKLRKPAQRSSPALAMTTSRSSRKRKDDAQDHERHQVQTVQGAVGAAHVQVVIHPLHRQTRRPERGQKRAQESPQAAGSCQFGGKTKAQRAEQPQHQHDVSPVNVEDLPDKSRRGPKLLPHMELSRQGKIDRDDQQLNGSGHANGLDQAVHVRPPYYVFSNFCINRNMRSKNFNCPVAAVCGFSPSPSTSPAKHEATAG